MTQLLQKIRATANHLLSPLGIGIIRTNRKDLHLYPEKNRPKIPQYINIGAGKFYHPYWHNVDTPNDYYADCQKGRLHIHYDLTSNQPLPFDDATIKVAYTSHVIEHINNDHVEYLFREVYRCLQPGGVFRITCPDMDLEYDAFIRGDKDFWCAPNAYGDFSANIEQRFLDHFATALTIAHPDKKFPKLSDDSIRDIFAKMSKEAAFDFIINKLPPNLTKSYPGDHINWFNYDKISAMLKSANFQNVYESRYSQSKCILLRNTQLFDSTCPWLSLYVECYKQQVGSI